MIKFDKTFLPNIHTFLVLRFSFTRFHHYEFSIDTERALFSRRDQRTVAKKNELWSSDTLPDGEDETEVGQGHLANGELRLIAKTLIYGILQWKDDSFYSMIVMNVKL